MATGDKDTFHYFGFGSNLLRERLQILNPTAVFKTTGRLQGYKLSFNGYTSNSWHGAPATILESPDDHVWGCVWTLHMKDLQNLDDQEGVAKGRYSALDVEVETAEGEKLRCRTYQIVNLASDDPRPSPYYLKVIIMGAKQNKLPQYYIDKLEAIEHNGYSGKCKMLELNPDLAKIVNS